MSTNGNDLPFVKAMMRRMIIWGPIIPAILSLIAASNAMLDDKFPGAGILLVASALSFAVMAYAYDKVT